MLYTTPFLDIGYGSHAAGFAAGLSLGMNSIDTIHTIHTIPHYTHYRVNDCGTLYREESIYSNAGYSWSGGRDSYDWLVLS